MKTKMNLDFSCIPVNDLSANIECHSVIDSQTGIEYVNLVTYIADKGISESTARRLIKEASGSKQSHLFVKLNGKYFLHDRLIDDSFRNPPKQTTLQDGYRHELKKYNWKIKADINYNNAYGILSTQRRMESFFRRLRLKFPRTNLNFFYSSERNSDRTGFHNHFLLAFGDEYADSSIEGFIVQHFRGKGEEPYANIHLKAYDWSLDGIGYATKKIKDNPDGYGLITHLGVPKR